MATRDHGSSWAAFAAGAVVMLVLALLWAAWSSREAGEGLLRAAAHVAGRPDLPIPRLPDTPRLPPAPSPAPR
jgi:hypothetical protein